ncbi:MAG: hypothetical protein V7K53_21410 [Nostoc sp.]|uniref:hypothetical protein n=1 Tax=Nostoc sp. TaxID=1180 RepID=UPI002FF97C17
MSANPVYADKLGIRPALQPSPLKAALLDCGGYDINGVNYDSCKMHYILLTCRSEIIHDSTVIDVMYQKLVYKLTPKKADSKLIFTLETTIDD